jgi:hypothetical protein
MIPEEHKEELIQSGINFMRSITTVYGADEGMKLWESISAAVDPDIKGQIFFAMLTGEYDDLVRLSGFNPGYSAVDRIKALRHATTPGLSLKEAKDLHDLLKDGATIKIKINPKKRNIALDALRDGGFYV